MSEPMLFSSAGQKIELNPLLHTLLLVDDTLSNLELLEDIFEEEYNLPVVKTGEEAWEVLQQHSNLFDAVLLDRMLPDILGEDILTRMKNHQVLQHIPVIFQTAKVSPEDVREGFQLGADFYVTKPYDEGKLIASVKTAVNKYSTYQRLYAEKKKTTSILGAFSLAKEGTLLFEFRTLAEAEKLSFLLSHVSPTPEETVTGLLELTYNAVEHGIAKIGYDEKTLLNQADTWQEEVAYRLNLPENLEKVATLKMELCQEKKQQKILFVITDPGDGFDHEYYRKIDEKRLFDDHGRGVAMGAMVAFDELHYNKKGNQVTAIVELPSSK
ncbi:MAG: response regulator [SAR324 cluster bacterium]|nr:response regulator [SAR324 cluster bacterium]